MTYHLKDGWYFERCEDGWVRVYHQAPGTFTHDQEFSTDANGWASIVASMSRQGETAETFAQALRFHGES